MVVSRDKLNLSSPQKVGEAFSKDGRVGICCASLLLQPPQNYNYKTTIIENCLSSLFILIKWNQIISGVVLISFFKVLMWLSTLISHICFLSCMWLFLIFPPFFFCWYVYFFISNSKSSISILYSFVANAFCGYI